MSAWSLDYVNRYYGLDVKRGQRVIVDGRDGVVTCGDGQYLRVRFDGAKHSVRVHPTWRVVFVGGGTE